MHNTALKADASDSLFEAFEHSITWEDDIWRADPVDVAEVHMQARIKFNELLDGVAAGDTAASTARILLFHGQSGAGKTHLLRALRTSSHRSGKAYFGYAQMTPDIGNYADFYLRRMIHGLEKPYCPDGGDESRSGLSRLMDHMVEACDELDQEQLRKLREDPLDDEKIGQIVLDLGDQIVSAPRYVEDDLDINIVRALLYLQRRDPRIDSRVRQYLFGRELTPLAQQAICALDPNTGEDRAFEIIGAIGGLIWSVEKAAIVFAIDQVEDLRFFDDTEDRFQRVARDLIQMANRLPNAIIIISSLEDFYGQVRGSLAQSYIDRIEKSGPVRLLETRTPEEARQIIAKRLELAGQAHPDDSSFSDPSQFFGPTFFEEFGGLSTRRLLEHAQSRLRARSKGDEGSPDDAQSGGNWLSALGNALGGSFGGGAVAPSAPRGINPAAPIDYREIWERFQNQSEAEIPSDDMELMDILEASLKLAKDEWVGAVTLETERVEISDELPVIDVAISHTSGLVADARIFLCNKPTQGGGLKRQLDRVLTAMRPNRACFMLRASDFPPNKKNQTAQAFRQFRDGGGREMLVPIPDWERLMTVREFHSFHRNDPGFAEWFETAKLLSNVHVIARMLRLDVFGRSVTAQKPGVTVQPGRPQLVASNPDMDGVRGNDGEPLPQGLGEVEPASAWGSVDDSVADVEEIIDHNEPIPLSDILDDSGSIYAGRDIGAGGKPITLNKGLMKRHAAVLGGSGSGKTTLALTLIEQLLLQGIPAILIDRKGDLCSYANPDVWREISGETTERQFEREKLADSIDVAVYTPGRSSGRPISITLLPNGISELPEHEQQLLANLSSAAIGEMLHLKNSATHQKQSGTLSVALKILGSRATEEVMLGDLIDLLEDEDPELTDKTQRMDPSGKLRRDLVAQLDSLRHRNSALFEGGGESMQMESFLGLGDHAKEDRARLSIIYTGFLGDNENILFWVSQFLSEALRFCQRNPNDELQAVVMFDEADLYIPANAKPATAEPLQSLLKRARSAGLGIMLATQSPGDLDYKSRDQITSWFIGRVREDTALKKLKAAFQSESGLDAAAVLPGQTVGEFHLVQEGLVRALKAQRSLITAEQVPFDRIEQLAFETRDQEKQQNQLKLFDLG
ncbi:MAG: helicase HerA-like domain-containing protein [Pseudomonadota bacterium]